eukprot:TRINITY_DN22688_c0_g2_i1.p2 TRINITY_DN22688_c0_g2~~TRINITY_DN22688_c0_g2_i1.p2  ORF type:complete len:106 (+),score=2.14 TRINITY_DN22688_c0_g2_i1:87-404(+)
MDATPVASAVPQTFDIYPLVESLAEAIEGGAGEQAIRDMVSELSHRFAACLAALDDPTFGRGADALDVADQREELRRLEQHVQHQRDILRVLSEVKACGGNQVLS